MKRMIMVLLLLTSGIVLCNAQGIKFEKGLNWAQVLAKAKAENKYIFVDCFATWCGPCKEMDAVVYPNKKVGELMDAKFLSVKLQFDVTPNDDDEVKQWHQTADAFLKDYKIGGFPSFLFFSPEGKLSYKDIGLKSPDDFISMANKALTDPQETFHKSLEEYKQGKKDYPGMATLIKLTQDAGNDELANEMIKDYKVNYLDKLDADSLTKDNLQFLINNYPLITSKDKIFALMYTQPARVDAAWIYPVSQDIVNGIISREEIEPYLWKDTKVWQGVQPITMHPDWKQMELTIHKKYPKLDALAIVSGSLNAFYNKLIYNRLWNGKDPVTQNPDWSRIEKDIRQDYAPAAPQKLVSAARMGFYVRIKNWKEYARLRDIQIKEHPPKAMPEAGLTDRDSWKLNTDAWALFDYCNDPKVLEQALAWSKLSVKLATQEDPVPTDDLQHLDTQANLLYKLGRTEEAIALEEKVLDTSTQGGKHKGDKQFQDVLDKMKKGEPTWKSQ